MLLTLTLVLMVPALCLGLEEFLPRAKRQTSPLTFCRTTNVNLYPGRDVTIQSHSLSESYYYKNNVNCQMMFRGGEDPLVLTINFQNFDVEDISDCRYDYLRFRNVKFCGTRPKNQQYQFLLPAWDNSTMTFFTDRSSGRRGFQFSLQARMYTGGIVTTPTGVVSGRSTPKFVNVSGNYTEKMTAAPPTTSTPSTTSRGYPPWYENTARPWNPTTTTISPPQPSTFVVTRTFEPYPATTPWWRPSDPPTMTTRAPGTFKPYPATTSLDRPTVRTVDPPRGDTTKSPPPTISRAPRTFEPYPATTPWDQHTRAPKTTPGTTQTPRPYTITDVTWGPQATPTWPPFRSTPDYTLPTQPTFPQPNPCYGHPCATHPCNPNNPNNPNNPRNPYSIYAVLEAVQYLQQEQFNRDHVLSLLQLFLQHNRM